MKVTVSAGICGNFDFNIILLFFLVSISVIPIEDNKALRERLNEVALPKIKNYQVKVGAYG